MELENVVEKTPEPTLRDSIAESIATLSEEPPVVKDEVAPAVDKTPAAKDAKPAAKDAKPAAKVTVKAHERSPVTKASEQKPPSITDTPPVTTDKVAAAIRGPVSWKPEVREKWAGLPPEVQTEVMRREHETSRALQDSAEARRFSEQFQQLIAPYQHYIALEGGNPLKTFNEYLRTTSMLRGGTPVEKANAIAQAVATFGVDVQMLDTALSQALNGRPMQQQQMGAQQFRDPRLDALLNQMQQRQANEEQTLNSELTNEVIEFAAQPENEFFEDLRLDISDLLRFSSERGQKMTLQEAYDKAAKLHPSISKIIDQRAQAKVAEEAKAKAIARRNAAGSINTLSPQQTGGTAEEASTVRAAIESSISRLST